MVTSIMSYFQQNGWASRSPNLRYQCISPYSEGPSSPKNKYDTRWIRSIISFRIKRNLTQRQLAYELFIPESTIRKLENNELVYKEELVYSINQYLSRFPIWKDLVE